jgi:hypothetical protein
MDAQSEADIPTVRMPENLLFYSLLTTRKQSSKAGPPGGKKKKARIIASAPSTSSSTQVFVELTRRRATIADPIARSSHSRLSSPKAQQHAESPSMLDINAPGISASKPTIISKNTERIEGPTTVQPPLKSDMIISLSSDDDVPPSHLSDTPSQLLEEVKKHTPAELLKEARMLALRLPESIPEAHPGDLLHVWDANSVDAIVFSLPDGGADPSEDIEFVDRTLNRVFQGTTVSRLVREMRRGSCGPLGIIEGLDFFAKSRGLNLVQFEIKLLKLVRALRKCIQYVCDYYYSPHDHNLTCHLYRPDHKKITLPTHQGGVSPRSRSPSPIRGLGSSPIHGLGSSPIRGLGPSPIRGLGPSPIRGPSPSLLHLSSPRVGLRSKTGKESSDQRHRMRHPHPSPLNPSRHQAARNHEQHDGSSNDGDSSELDDDSSMDEDDTTVSPDAKTRRQPYKKGPLPTELVNEVDGLVHAFNDALAKVAKKHNRPLHQVERLANLTSTMKGKRVANPFNGYARKRKKEGLPTCK